MSRGRLKWVIMAGLAVTVMAAALIILPAVRSAMLTDDQRRQRIEDLYAEYRKLFPDVPEMTVSQLLVAQKTGKVVLVDVREPAEQEVSMIPGAIPGRQFEEEGKLHETKQIVVYCTIGYRSGLYAKKLDKQDRHVFNLKGGILAWAHAGKAVVDLKGPTKRVHVYGRAWNLLPRGYEAVW